MKKQILIFISILFVFTNCNAQQNLLEENYVKQEYKIEMRDGTKLFTSVYTPKDDSQNYPIILRRTPYSAAPYGISNYPKNIDTWKHLIEEGYIFVFQDVRGRFMSEGEYVNMRPYIPQKSKNQIDETTDTYDTIEWLINNIPNNNGKVGLYGISYPGFYSSMGAIDAHPNLICVSPQAPIADWFIGDDFHHNGAFNLPLAFSFFSTFGIEQDSLYKSWPKRSFEFNTEDGYKFYLDMGPLKNANNKYLKNEIPFWNDLMNNGTYNDFWKSRNIRPHLKNINPAVMVVGGFFDAENCFGALETYKSIENQNPTINNTLVMGPWYHGGWVRSDGDKLGNVFFGSMTSEYYIQNVELPFFNYHLKGKGELNLPEALIFETGSNVWKSYESWPPKNLIKKDLFINSDGTLTFNKKEDQNEYTEYVSDPSNPVPYTQTKSVRMVKEYMVEDQRFVSDRSDVLIFESDILENNLTLAGPINVEFFVSTSGTDSDWIVKIIDVFPDDHPNYEFTPDSIKMGGFQMLVRGDIMRGKFRNSFENPEPFIPNEVTKISFALNDVSHTFKKGHKIMVQIQSSWFPLFDRNPQKFVDIYNADESDFQKAVNRVYSSNDYPSKIEINVIE